tara:strand:- start:18889 stop:19278 length:390 start_codon:yes stop_codon:yes gene_type:complete
MKISEKTPISMPMKNLISIVGACLIGAWFAFSVIERLNVIETEQKLMYTDLDKANEFISGVPKGDMVSPQINELFMLVEFLSANQEKLKKNVEDELPELKKLNLQIEFLTNRIDKLESSLEKVRNGKHE